MGRLIDADKIIFCEIDEVGGEYEPYLGCSKSQIDSLPTVDAIPKADYETRLKADMTAILEEVRKQLKDMRTDFYEQEHKDISFGINIGMEEIQKKINSLKEK